MGRKNAIKGLLKKIVALSCAIITLGAIVMSICTIFPIQNIRLQYTNVQIGSSLDLASDPNAFVSVWDTNQIHLPLESNGTYDFFVDWGDGTNDTITTWNQAEVTHTYSSAGTYTVAINGTIIGWRFNNQGYKLKIVEIQQWGCLQLGNSGGYFYGCNNLVLAAQDSLNLTGTTSLYRAFSHCYNIGSNGKMNTWDVSNVTDMSYMFHRAFSFNHPIGNWNISRVTNTSFMFYTASHFNQPIGNWNVSRVTNMSSMFNSAYSFNQALNLWDVSMVVDMNRMFSDTNTFNEAIGNWNVSSVTDMRYMFYYSREFNQPLQNWNVSNVITMEGMFEHASSFNQAIGNWSVSNVRTMKGMFQGASSFNQYIGNWDVSNVNDMSYMFYSATNFNYPLNTWDVSSVVNMYGMFLLAFSFNKPLDFWDVSNVNMMGEMFSYTYRFNQPLNSWDVSNVFVMSRMFSYAHHFNQPLSNWDVSHVYSMYHMFSGASSFNQALGTWDVSSVTDMRFMFYGVDLSSENYDDLLTGWSQLDLQTGVIFDAGDSRYSKDGKDARDLLITTFEWIITDGGPDYFVPSPIFKIMLISLSSILVLGGGAIGILFTVKKRKESEEFDETQIYPLEINETRVNEYVGIRAQTFQERLDAHVDENLYYIEKFEEQKKILNKENYKEVRENLIDLLQRIKIHNQTAYINEKLHSDISELLWKISEKYDDT